MRRRDPNVKRMVWHGILGLWHFRLKKLEILPLPCLLEFGHFIFKKNLNVKFQERSF